MNVSFDFRAGQQGRWQIYSLVLSAKELIQLCSHNVRTDGQVWKSDFYAGTSSSGAMNRPITRKRTSSLKEYIKERLQSTSTYPGALPSLSIAAFCDSIKTDDSSVTLKGLDKVVLVDGLGRYSALLESHNAAVAEGESLDIDVAVTLFCLKGTNSEEDVKAACRQILHDFNYFGTKMRAATSAGFDSADAVSPVARMLHSKLTQRQLNANYGSLKQACVLLGAQTADLYLATKKIKDRSDFDETSFNALYQSNGIDALTTALADCFDTLLMRGQGKLLAPVLQMVLHTVGRNPSLLNSAASVASCLTMVLTENPRVNTSWRTRTDYESFSRTFYAKLRTQGLAV